MSLKISKKRYPKNSAGALMTDKVPIAFFDTNILEVERYLKRKKSELESINYIYIIDTDNVLKGAVSIKEIFRQGKNKKIADFIEGKLITINPYSDGEKAANLALKHNIKSVPVVNKEGKFLGVVLSDTILEIAYRAAYEDLSLLAGVENTSLNPSNYTLSTIKSFKNRLPWLILGMLGGFAMSKTIDFFEGTLTENIILASFIPLIVYMAAAVQTQIGFFIVRDLAFDPKIKFLAYSWRQLKVVTLLGAGVGILVFLFAYLFYQDLIIVTALSIAIFLTILSSIFTGVFIPWMFHRLKFDPASASGPIATILQDLISIVIYLLIAKSLL